MDGAVQQARLWAAAALLLAVVLAGQAVADGLVAPAEHAGTERLLGRTGFAYLTGIRRYTAAVLWARLDPINDDYYHELALGNKTFLLPSIRIVNTLDPEFEDPYYVGPFVLFGAGQKTNAVTLAEEGVRQLPDSALLHASYAQLLLVEGRLAEARRQADLTLSTRWASESDEYQLLSALEVIFNRTGAPDKAAFVASERSRLRAKFEATGAMPSAPQ